MGKVRSWRPSYTLPFEPRGYEPFNIIMSIQYRGWKEAQFHNLDFSARDSVQRALNTLQLPQNLEALELPRVLSLDRVSARHGYANTVEVMYPNCEGRGVCWLLTLLIEESVTEAL